jgi:sortase (surface protein transpeptidase)
VILGHVDSYAGPGVFFRLRSLLPGDDIIVQAGQRVFRFEVSKLVTYPKDHFATAAVYGPTPDAELRLVTCGGPFDRSIGHYVDNIVVYAIRNA